MGIVLATLLLFLLFRLIMAMDGGVFRHILLIGLGLRLALLICTCTDFIEVPDAHVDADYFHDVALSHSGLFADSESHYTNYTRIVSFIYVLTDDSRWFAQFMNLSLGVMTLVYIRRILCVLCVRDDYAKRMLLVAALMPFLNIYSVVLLREAWVTFFIVLSLYYFVRWYLKLGNGGILIVKCIASVVIAMWMHSGVIGILLGYFLAFIFYYRDKDKVRISKSSYVGLFFLVVIFFVLIFNLDTLFSKLNVEDFGEYAETKSSGEGGDSDYLTWLDLSSPSKLLLYLPLKMFYFLFSPIIIDWRGVNDVAAFVLDSSVYIVISWVILTRKVAVSQYRLLKRFLLLSIIITIILFSFGTSNTGTAIRHRAKICSFLLITASISTEKKHRGKCYHV